MRITKKIIFSILIIAIINSCDKKAIESETTFGNNFEISKVSKIELSNDIKRTYQKNLVGLSMKISTSEFDFEEITSIYNVESGTTSYMVESNDNKNIKLGVYPILMENSPF